MLDYQRVPSEMNIDIPQKDCYRVSELSPPPKKNKVLLGMFFFLTCFEFYQSIRNLEGFGRGISNFKKWVNFMV